MRKNSGLYGDSLEMLLDTMCNLLGGVIFIALMVSLLARETPPPQPEYYETQAAEMTRELAAATGSNAWLQAEIGLTVQRLQQPSPPTRTNRMRLPTIQQTTKEAWHVIVRHGQIYPLARVSPTARDGRARNTRTLEWPGGMIKPLPGQGEDPDRGVTEMVQALRRNARTNVFLAFWVYEDSFTAFDRAKETAARLDFQYGWEPVARDQQITQRERGEIVLPQN